MSLLNAEEWKWIKGYENRYQVSSFGRVRSFINPLDVRILASRGDKDGYKYIILRDYNHLKHTHRIHRLVASTFIENPNNYPVINHKDGCKQNNTVDNLEFCTRSQNDLHAFRLGLRTLRGERNNNNKLTEEEVVEIYKMSWTPKIKQTEIAQKFNIKPATVSAIKLGANWGYLTSKVGVDMNA